MMKRLVAGFLFAAGFCPAQIRFVAGNPEPDAFKPSVRDLAGRLAASDYVITGVVVKIEHVRTRLFAQQLAEIEQLSKEGKDPRPKGNVSDLGRSITLFTVRADSVLCQKANFHPGSAMSAPLKEFYLFNPLGPRLDTLTRNENLQEGSRYLFFLGKDSDLDELMARFDLDSSVPYYRVLRYSEGAIELPPEGDESQPFKPAGYSSDTDLATPVLKTATALCQAVQPSNVFQKIDGLERLKSSPDLTMRDNADAAVKLIDPSR